MIDFDKIAAEMQAQKPMMATYLIQRLLQIVGAHGDMPVVLGHRDQNLREVITHDADGDTVGTPIEIALYGW
ncbi:hypothetical protein H4P12_08330 [Paracoccus sp. 11-3]|uniref:Uncharacterized protein n=1 Tax=Paracoccus amoyensis TaxID=2760093 RepID=A0A926G6H9_9RHOB|nr:hypothetical protein [Paracoccus amoyensis]MBC9246718.1 hypothetical protein [Paracoccus amoyensis]